ncbi:MAG: hypothetical protein QOE14_907 [Humisphaera sp.]|nr:hypothetical protein [Humisphaera sp.]
MVSPMDRKYRRCLLMLMCVAWSPIAVSAATYHVAPSGRDTNDGSNERPFATIARACDVVRATNGKPAPQTIILHAGTYVLTTPLELGPWDSGTAEHPVTWQAAANEEVRVSGGPTLKGDAFMAVTDEKILARLRPAARGKVLRTDLSRLGDAQFAAYPDTFRGVPAAPELFFNDQRMTVARWPNQGWATIASIVDSGAVPREGDQSGRPGVFTYSGDDSTPARWDIDTGVWLQGYWCYDWYDEAIRIKSIDREKRQITLAAPAVYGIKQGNPSPRRFRALNVLEELDEPGEFYIDRAERLLYFWPPTSLANARVTISTLDGPLLRLKDVSHFTLSGVIFEACLGDGIEISGGRSVSIERCTVRNTRQLAIRAVGGTNHRIDHCDIYDTGTGGVILEGGDRKTLTPAGHEATNNRIHHFSRHQQTAAYAISLGGVGNRAANNLISDAPHQAVFIGGNDHVFELNILRNVVNETDDAGAVYKGRNPSCRGNIIRHNFFADIGSPMGHGTAAIYFDDGDGGDLVFGNIFVRSGHPGAGSFGTVFSHGGHGIRAENNIFVDCKRPFGSATWNDQLWKETIDGGHDCHFTEKLLKEVDITKPPYTTRYPELVGFMNPKPGEPRNSFAKNNVFVRSGEASTGNWVSAPAEMWTTSDDPGFIDAANGNYQLRTDAEVFKRLPGFKPIPFDQIGPRAATLKAVEFESKPIYHSPQSPGYSAWCSLWRTPAGELRLAFQQVTGPVEDATKRKNVTVILASSDEAATWKTVREVPARTTAALPGNIYAAPASSSFCGHGFASLPDGTLVTGLWPAAPEKSGYIQRSTDDGVTWSPPIYFLDPDKFKSYPTQIRRLKDGRLMLVAGVVSQADAKTSLWLLKQFFESRDDGKTWSHVWTMPADVGLCEEADLVELDSGDLLAVHRAEHYAGQKYIGSDRLLNVFHRKGDKWEIGPVHKAPFPHSGYPELLKTREGVILHIATDGVWQTADDGKSWTKLDVPASPYYPRATQLNDGRIFIVGHVGGDDEYGKVDQTIVQQTFRLQPVAAK